MEETKIEVDLRKSGAVELWSAECLVGYTSCWLHCGKKYILTVYADGSGWEMYKPIAGNSGRVPDIYKELGLHFEIGG